MRCRRSAKAMLMPSWTSASFRMRAPTPASSMSRAVPSSSTPALMRDSTCSRVRQLEDDVVDPGVVEQLAEQQPRRSGADDRDLRAHRQ